MMASQTGSTYISDIMIHQRNFNGKPEFSNTRSSTNLFLGDCNNDPQPEIVLETGNANLVSQGCVVHVYRREAPRLRLRSSTDRSCAVPCTHNTFGDRSFAAAGPRVWNSLPVHLHDKDITYISFEHALNTYRFIIFGAQCDILLNCAI